MDDKVVSFEVNATQVATAKAPARPAAPVAAPRRHSDHAIYLARLAALYADLVGVEVTASDLLEHMLKSADALGAEPDLRAAAASLTAAGLRARLTDERSFSLPESTPYLAQMTDGQVVLVLDTTDASVDIYDPQAADMRLEVPLDEFLSVFSGVTLQASVAVADLEKRHVDAKADPHWFWGEFRHYKRQFSEAAAGSLVANLLAVAVALFSLQVYDRVIPYQSQPTLWVLTIGVLLAVALESVLKLARTALIDTVGKRIELSVQARLMQRLLGMKLDPAARRPSEVFAAMRDFSSVREFFTASTVATIADLPFLIVFLALVASIGGNLVWVLLLGGLLMVVPGFLMQKRMIAIAASSQGASTKAARLLYESVFEHETITTQNGQGRAKRIWSELTALAAAKAGDQRKLTAALTTWAQAVQQVTYISAVVAGTYLVFTGDFTVGTIIAIGILTGRTLGPLAQVSSMLARWSQVKAALTALDAIANSRQAEEAGRRYLRRDRLAGAFELRSVEFQYDPKASPTVEIAAVAIPAGQHVAILGTNGSGKSTLLRLLAGLHDPTKGRILLDGVDMGQIHPRDLRRGIGYLGQDVRLVSGTVRDNLNLSQLERDDHRLLQALDFAGLGPFVRNHPRGLDLEIRELGEGLSVGQRQSIGWARLWLQDPQVVILDEPTAALDQTLEATMVSRLTSWLEGRTAIIATHRVPILQLTTRTLILQNGRLAVDGPKDAVLAHLTKVKTGAGAP